VTGQGRGGSVKEENVRDDVKTKRRLREPVEETSVTKKGLVCDSSAAGPYGIILDGIIIIKGRCLTLVTLSAGAI
jgi:hypothetical protein